MKMISLMLLMVFMILLALNSYSAELKDIIQHCYENSDGTNKWLDYRGNNSINLTQSVKKNQSGLHSEDNESITFASSSTTDWGMFNTTEYLDNQSEGAICSWFNVTEDPDDTLFFIGDPSSNSIYAQFKVNTDGAKDQMAFQIVHTNANNVVVFAQGSNFELGAPQFACIGYNNGTYWAYHNGTNKSVSFEAGGHPEGWFKHIINAGNTITSANIGVRDRSGAAGRDYYLNGNYGKLYILNGTPTTEQLGNLSNFTRDTPQGIKPMNCSTLFNSTPADSIFPRINISLNNTALIQGRNINITGNSSDNEGLSFCQIILNQTGINEYFNTSLSGASGFCSQNISISISAGVINFTALVNDTNNNKNQSSTIINVGDVTNPILNNCTLSAASITDASGNIINLTCNAEDESNIQTMVARLNGTINKTLTFSFSQSQTITSTYSIFQSSETLLVGSYSISQVNVTDTSGNKLSNTTRDLHFEVASAPSGGGSVTGGGGGGGSIQIIEEKIIILGNLTLTLMPPIIKSNFLYTPFKTPMQRFSLTLLSNKVVDSCISKVFECKITSNNSILVALNYSNDSIFISKVIGNITLIDKAKFAKTIDAEVRFINLAYALPISMDVASKNYMIFRLKGSQIAGIRVWFIIVLFAAIALGVYLYYKEL